MCGDECWCRSVKIFLNWRGCQLSRWSFTHCGLSGQISFGCCGSVPCHGALPHTARDGTCRLQHIYSLKHTYLPHTQTGFTAESVSSSPFQGVFLGSSRAALLTMRINQLTALTCADWSSGAGEGALPAPSPPQVHSDLNFQLTTCDQITQDGCSYQVGNRV